VNLRKDHYRKTFFLTRVGEEGTNFTFAWTRQSLFSIRLERAGEWGRAVSRTLSPTACRNRCCTQDGASWARFQWKTRLEPSVISQGT